MSSARQETLRSWTEMLARLAGHYGIATSPETAAAALAWGHARPMEDIVCEAAREAGLEPRVVTGPTSLKRWSLPVLVELKEGRVAMLLRLSGAQAIVVYSGSAGLESSVALVELEAQASGRVLLARPDIRRMDARVEEFTQRHQWDWFWSTVLQQWPAYSKVFLASLLVNILGLAATLFSMQVFDRVVPAQSEATLWALLVGVIIALAFELLLKLARTQLSDRAAKNVDLALSSFFFGRALRIRNDARPKSTGSFIAQLREIEQVRELMTSVTINALADLPFVLLFLGVLYYLGGATVWVLLAAVMLLLVPGIMIQPYMAKLSRTGLREAGIRNAVLVEAIECVEDIKLLQAEPRFQMQWDKCNAVAANVGMRQRLMSALLVGWTQELQSLVYVCVIVAGVYQVFRGDMSIGTLVGVSILASRTIAPLAMLATIFSRWQQAKVAREGLDNLLKKPTDKPERGAMLHRPVLRGNYEIRDVVVKYSEDAKAPALRVDRLQIGAGERVGIIGRVGAGKSTLLQLLSGMVMPHQGHVLLDGTSLELIEPADVRRDVGVATQHSRLFFGTLRENLLMGQPHVSDEQLLAVLETSGAQAVVQGHPKGLDGMLGEGGNGLSGGQRQALILARTLLRNPNVILLDEPTASFDDGSELQFVRAFNRWSAGKTVVISTHRSALFSCVDRLIVLEGGRVALDGPKHLVLDRLKAATVLHQAA